MKYIIIETNDIEVAIMFNILLQHNKVAGDRKVISAGFCSVVNKRGEDGNLELDVVVWGQSISCNVKHRPEDAKIILDAINRRG